jgi:predicted CoA-binding protein
MRVHIPDGAEASHRGNALKRAPTTDATSDVILEILRESKTIAVVGLSSNLMRPSHGVAEYMQGAGYRIIPVNPNEREVLGEKSYARLEDVPEKVDIVDIFRRVEEVPAVVESAIRIGAKVVWMQMGIENEEAAEKARAAGLMVIEDACILVEHKKRRWELS